VSRDTVVVEMVEGSESAASPSPQEAEAAFLRGGGLTGDILRSRDWSTTPLGSISTWPTGLKTLLATVLRAPHPMLLWWGSELIQFYNDSFVPSLGIGKHPAALGQRGKESWAEVWPIVGSQIERVMSRGQSFWSEDALVPILRNGRIEEVHWTYGYSPVVDDRGLVAGVLIVCSETTSRVVAERRLGLIRALVEKTSKCVDMQSVMNAAYEVLATATYDVPFTASYSLDAAKGVTRLRCSENLEAPLLAASDELVRESAASGTLSGLSATALLALPVPFPGGAWPEPCSSAFVLPVKSRPGQILLLGVSPRLRLDADYQGFFEHFVEQIDLASERARAIQRQGGIERERRNLLLQAPMPTALLTGPKHLFELANPPYLEMVGREVVGQTYLQAFPEVEGTALPGILAEVYETGRPFVAPESLVRFDRNRDGALEDCFFRFNLEALRDGDGHVYGMMVVAFDITEQVDARHALEHAIAEAHQVNEQLAQTEHVLRSLVDNLPELAWSARADGYVDFYNRRWYEYTGTSFEQMQGWGWKGVHDPALLGSVMAHWQKSLDTGEPFEMEYPLRGADGEFRWFLTRVRPLRDGAGKIARWFGVNTNIHESKALARELEAASIAKDEFLATVSHELRTPLNAILGWSHLIRNDTQPERIEKGLTVIERNAKAQAQLIEDLLDVSRIISGKVRMSMRRVDLASVASAAVEAAQPSAAAKGVLLSVSLEDQLGEIVADEDRLQQVIWNLLSNGVKFTPKGGEVALRLERVDSRVTITVRDSGQGISAGLLPRVFDRFRQGDSSSTRAHGGLGLGLAIVRHLVELHGGTANARSDGEGKGATFQVDLPIHAVEARDASLSPDHGSGEASASLKVPPSSRLRGVHVLVVDDQEDARDLVATVLEGSGASVSQASSASAAMAILSTVSISVIVSDVGMPGEDGYAFLKQVRSNVASARTRGLPALALTAYARGEDRDKALASGFQEHVAKPIDPTKLVDVVAGLVRR
jgi:PAS domain S-box-containing protein